MSSKGFNVFSAIDKSVLILYFAILLFGWMNIYSTSVGEEQTSIFDISYRSGMQFLWFCISWFVATIILLLDRNIFSTLAYLLYGAIIIVLIATIFLAPDIKGSRSWLPLGPFSIQPAEFSKFITALALSKLMSKPGFKLSGVKNYAMVCSLLLLPMLIIIIQSETGSALVYLSFIIMLYREGLPSLIPIMGFCAVLLFVLVIRFSDTPMLGNEEVSLGLFIGLALAYVISLIFYHYLHHNKKDLIFIGLIPVGIMAVAFIVNHFFPFNMLYAMGGIIAAAIIYIAVMAFKRWRMSYVIVIGTMLMASIYCFSAGYIFSDVLQSHQRMRIKVLLGMENDPTGISYNTNQARIAIGSGGFFGKGYMQGTQTKLKYVPEQDTDFIFCTVGEEWGFLGSVALLGLYLALILRIIFLAERQERKFVRIYGYCVAGIFTFHLFINVGMVLGLVPVIGIPLPFFSYGGSSFLSFTTLLFIFLKLDTGRLERTNG